MRSSSWFRSPCCGRRSARARAALRVEARVPGGLAFCCARAAVFEPRAGGFAGFAGFFVRFEVFCLAVRAAGRRAEALGCTFTERRHTRFHARRPARCVSPEQPVTSAVFVSLRCNTAPRPKSRASGSGLFGDLAVSRGSVSRGALRHVHRVSSAVMVSSAMFRSRRRERSRVGCSVLDGRMKERSWPSR